MWNPFQKKHEPIWNIIIDRINDHLHPRHTARNIGLGALGVIVGVSVVFFSLKQPESTPTPILPPTTKATIASGEAVAQTGGELQQAPVEQVCIKHPDISFFMYHYIRDDDPQDTDIIHNLSVPPGIFREHMQYIHHLAASGSITLMHGEDFLKSLKTGCFPGNPIWIFTSDDGWTDTYTDLVPIAREFEVPFFLGIIVDRIGVDGFVSTGEIQEISADPLFTVSSHSIDHRDESEMSGNDEYYEMCESKRILESLLQKSVETYIYPSGKMNTGAIDQNLRSCGYTLAWTTSKGKDWSWPNPPLDELNRIRVNHDDSPTFYKNILSRYLELESGGLLKDGQ